jgi:hypothetical protein
MPWVEVLQLLSMAPPRAGTTYAYHSWFPPIVKLDQCNSCWYLADLMTVMSLDSPSKSTVFFRASLAMPG